MTGPQLSPGVSVSQTQRENQGWGEVEKHGQEQGSKQQEQQADGKVK